MAFLDEIRKESIGTIEGSIYFDKIIGDGVIKSVNHKYVKMYKIEDINYRLSDDEGKLSILSNFMNFFNNTDRDIGISIIMTCKQNVDEFYIEERDDIIVGENEVKFILDDKKRITVHKFKGKIKVDIREFYEDKGEMKPGKKGISLSLENWEKLKGFIDNIDESVDNLK